MADKTGVIGGPDSELGNVVLGEPGNTEPPPAIVIPETVFGHRQGDDLLGFGPGADDRSGT